MRLQPSLELLNLWRGTTLRAFPLLFLNQNAGSCRGRCSDLFSACWELYARRWGALRDSGAADVAGSKLVMLLITWDRRSHWLQSPVLKHVMS